MTRRYDADPDDLADEFDEQDARHRPSRRISAEAKDKLASHSVARVVGLHRGHVDLLIDDRVVSSRYGGSMRGERAVVGDFVRFREPKRSTDVPRVTTVEPRATQLRRSPDDDSDDLIDESNTRVVAANVDLIFAVVGIDNLAGGIGLADRALAVAEHDGIEAIVVFNKSDLANAGQVDEHASAYRSAGYDVVVTSAIRGDGIDRLTELVLDRWAVLSGHSGVGKSSLFNLLVPDARASVGELGTRGGRHTTVSTQAWRVPEAPGGWLIDTPGVRSFGLAHIAAAELAGCFPELRDLSCTLPSCLHSGEEGCAIAEAEIAPSRLDAYRRLLAVLS